jgi:esterase/lipase superfamily enzyme
MFRCAAVLFALVLSLPAWAAEIRLALPAAYADDAFFKTLVAAPELRAAGLALSPRPAPTGADALRAAQSGEADLAVFTLADEDRGKLRQASDEARLLTRPFIFSSSREVFLMQKSFLGATAAAGAGETGLLPLRLWNHAITYLLTDKPLRGPDDFKGLKLAVMPSAKEWDALSRLGARAKGDTDIGGGVDGRSMQLGAEDRDWIVKSGRKRYLTVVGPETGVVAAAPGFWSARGEAEKAALSKALEKAAAAAEAELNAREEALRENPLVEFTRIDAPAHMDMAMKAAGREAADLHEEMRLWRRAEEEVHATPAPMPASKRDALSPVLFATDRNDEGGPALATRFGARRLEAYEISCGFLGAPKRMSGEPQIPDAAQASAKGVEACAGLIAEKTRAAGLKKILFAVHGFNTSFEGLLWRALQLGSDLDYDGAIVGWSWPSEGSAFAYAYDEDSNLWSEPHFLELVEAVAAAGPDMQLDFVAHSMGNRILLQMLRDFALARENPRIGAAIFAAPDVAQDVFREQIRMARSVGALRTLYASQYDHAILISESLHRAPRAGSGGDAILVAKGFESVDARLSGHSYLFDESKAIMDFRKVVNDAARAPARGLEAKEKAGAAYWVIAP